MVLGEKAKSMSEAIYGHLEEYEVNGYLLKVFDSDPYYHIEVTKNGKHVEDHLLSNAEDELVALIETYKKMK